MVLRDILPPIMEALLHCHGYQPFINLSSMNLLHFILKQSPPHLVAVNSTG